ncbi:hypothetical protein I0C86_41135 [Plantactinospora sp. S1510]|uniref:GNAT family N-acetyltransferase n=1 Tax=Plantactinospora alkalitolerans TaxID=2789879 RepID=A0ABS0H9U5_9ACTN|nr:hypothetical protein [Plantactinospora alkalitolerans]MBF9135257.1 hypothetical protein [Plantactinospora alkalitolerans]
MPVIELEGCELHAIVPRYHNGEIQGYFVAGVSATNWEAVSAWMPNLTGTAMFYERCFNYDEYDGRDGALREAIRDACDRAGLAGWLNPGRAFGSEG